MKNLRELRKKKKLTQKELGEKINVSECTISQYENRMRQPNLDTLRDIADVLGVSVDSLLGRDKTSNTSTITPKAINTIKIPIYGKIPAGTPLEMVDESYIEDYVELDTQVYRTSSVYFALKIKGDSMFPEFRPNDVVIFRKQETCENGDYCAVTIGKDSSTFKKVLKKDNGITLMPLNPNYDPMFFTNKEIANIPVSVLGVIKEVRRKY